MNKPISGIDISGCVDFYPKGNEHIQKLEDLGWDKQSIDKANTPQPKQDNTDLDAICQDLQEKTYTQAMRIAELEAKLLDKQQFTNVVNPSIHAGSGEKTGEKHDFHHSGIEQKPLASDGSDGSTYKKAIDDVKKAYGITSDMKQEHVDKTAKQRHEENT